MKWNRKRKALAIIAVYGILWALTATSGIRDVDRAFDREFAVGTIGFTENLEHATIQRIDEMTNIRDPGDAANEFPDDIGLFRFRTRGIAVAPFVIVDEAATVYASLGGFGGRRVNVWFFGWTKWWLVESYWAA